MKIWGTFGIILIILMFFYYAYLHIKNSGIAEANTVVLQEENKKQIATVKIKKKQENIIANPTGSNIDYRIEWLQFIWREDPPADK